MPKTAEGDSYRKKYKEEDISKALVAIENGMSQREASKSTMIEDVQASVKYFLDSSPRENPFKNNCPGKGWYAAFLKRHQNITLRTSEGITSTSSVVFEADIRKWFSTVEAYLAENQLTDIIEDPSRIYNGDETCFWLCPKNKKVLAPKRGVETCTRLEHHPKNNITVMFTFSAR
ncbi:hypothetical protein NQ318_020652 [Aromia moschata]|uniref:HTH CENPB-type domain-containing protein n=1 Tax=Aromia moschata TaxID=1265417 RepID=A0AAV8X0W9_9CUCU|nr:hypothetical protein NQ318_020652 [Aromia moschata]